MDLWPMLARRSEGGSGLRLRLDMLAHEMKSVRQLGLGDFDEGVEFDESTTSVC